MRSWTEQPGYPLVEIVRDNATFVITQVDVDNTDNVLYKKSNNIGKNKRSTIFQERFLVYGSDDTVDNNVTEWIIGLTYTTQNRKDFNDVLPKTWMKGNKTVLTDEDGTGWYIFNLQSIGKVVYNL